MNGLVIRIGFRPAFNSGSQGGTAMPGLSCGLDDVIMTATPSVKLSQMIAHHRNIERSKPLPGRHTSTRFDPCLMVGFLCPDVSQAAPKGNSTMSSPTIAHQGTAGNSLAKKLVPAALRIAVAPVNPG